REVPLEKVGREDAHLDVLRDEIEQARSERVGFLAGGAAGAPDVDALLASGDPLRDQRVADEGELLRVAEEEGLADGDRLVERVQHVSFAIRGAEQDALAVVGQPPGGATDRVGKDGVEREAGVPRGVLGEALDHALIQGAHQEGASARRARKRSESSLREARALGSMIGNGPRAVRARATSAEPRAPWADPASASPLKRRSREISSGSRTASTQRAKGAPSQSMTTSLRSSTGCACSLPRRFARSRTRTGSPWRSSISQR